MERRSFLKNMALGSSSVMIIPPGISLPGWDDDLVNEKSNIENLFQIPPDESRPWVFWQWMNGNITAEGITLDLEAMKRMGIGGSLCFNNAVGIVRGPIDYASEEWFSLVEHATSECARLGLKIMFHNGAGYSGSGGQWVTPERSMQQLVWTEVQLKNQKKIQTALPQPQIKADFYKDICVLAYPSLRVENGLMKDKIKRISLDGNTINITVLWDENPDSKIRMENKEGKDSILDLEFETPFEARSITIIRKAETPKDLFDGPRDHPPLFILEASQDGNSFIEIARFNSPQLREMDTPTMQNFKSVKASYYRLRATIPSWLSSIELHAAPRLAGWPGKANWTHGSSSADAPDYDESLLINPEKVIDITKFMGVDGELNWKAPQKGNWTIVRLGHTSTGEEPAAHPDAAKGLEIDKFNKAAVQFHYDKFLSKFIDKLAPYKTKTFQGFTTDSWEAGKQNWSVVLPQEFEKRRNYSIGAWLLVMTGRILKSEEASNRFLWDMNKTQAELLSNNYYGEMQKICHENGLEYHAEPYGDGNLDSLQAGQFLDVPMAEFWIRYIYGGDMTSKQAASIAHAYGKKVVGAEAFTGMPLTSKWTGHPYAFKAQADYFLTLGINRLIFHVFVHQPYTTAFPGMTMGPFGTHFDRNNTWSELLYGWTDHLRRSQYLLQQGLTVADVCYFKGDNPESGVPDIYQFLPKGYKGDVIGRDALFNRLSIDNGNIVLPDGMSYKLCIMDNLDAILFDTLERITQLVKEGMILIVSNKPQNTLGQLGADNKIKVLADELYGNLDGKQFNERRYGKGKIVWGTNYEAIFDSLNIKPDFDYSSENQDATIHYAHKKGEEFDYYFISNHRRRKEKINCSFRITGFTPEIWHSETGRIQQAPFFTEKNGRTVLSLELDPAEAFFVVFRKNKISCDYNSIVKDGQVLLGTTTAYPLANVSKYKAISTNFSIAFWAKPESYAHNGKSMVFHPANPVGILDKGAAFCGLNLGQNGVKIYERAGVKSESVLSYENNIEGWSHFALVYKENIPFLYVNGQLVEQGIKSKYRIHPGLDTPANNEQFQIYFEGNYTPFQLYKRALLNNDIIGLYLKGRPENNVISEVLMLEKNNKAIFTENGEYLLEGVYTKKVVIKDCSKQLLNQNWKITFPKNSGAPSEIYLNQLKSLRLHENFDVKHFSGTASYFKTIQVNALDFIRDRIFILDLGQVEVIARVFVNGKEAKLLWKEPYRADITNLLKEGANEILIKVTSLFPNRLIGDEYLAIENEYSEHGFIEKFPDWYTKNQEKPGSRKTFSVWKNYKKTDPLVESGLLGPVKLIMAIEKRI